MQNDDLTMDLFNEDFDLDFDNLDQDFLEEDQEDDSDKDLENNKKTVEDEDPEEVDSDEDDSKGGDEQEDEDSDDSSSNIYSSLASFIHEQGLLPSLDIDNLKIDSPDDLAEAIKTEISTQAEQRLKDYIDNIDIENIAKSKSEIQNLESIDENFLRDNIDKAKDIIYQDYLNQGLDEKKATRLLNRLIDLGEDAILEDALESLSSLKEFNSRKIEEETKNYQKQIELQKEEEAKIQAEIKKNVYDRKDLINGYKLNKVIQDKVYKTINEPVGKNPETGDFENKFMRDRRQNPVEFDVRMYVFYELTDGFKDFSKLSTPAKSKAVSELEKAFKKSSTNHSGANPSFMKDPNSYNIGDEIVF